MTAIALQRAGPLIGLPDLLVEWGIRPEDVFGPFAIEPETLHEDVMLPFDTLLALVDLAARRSGHDDLGLILASRYSVERHGILGRLMRSAPTLERALLDFVRFQQVYSTGAVVYLNRLGSEYAIGYGSYRRTRPGTRQLYDASIAASFRLVRELSGGTVTPVEILFSLRRPADISSYEKLFPCPIRFDQEQTCLVLSATAMKARLPQSDPVRYAATLKLVEATLATTMGTVAQRVRHAIRPLVHEGKAAMPQVARAIGTRAWTLRRQLAKEGVTFGALRDDVRHAMACEFLAMTELPIGGISLALDFATHASFVRAFRRWSGRTPTEFRLEHQT